MTDTLAAEPRLRQISALFVDVAGPTAMSQRLDPEEAAAVLDTALARFAAVIAAHGGRVLRFMGDGLFAAFGADLAREDDAEQAVRAGLALLAEARRHAADLQREHGIERFDVRVGVHTGTALLGGGVEAGNNASGIAINIAARMEQTAPVGGLRITHDTQRLVRGLFDVAVQAPLQVKGHDAPLVTYLVRGLAADARPQAHRGVAGVATPLIGRDAEFAALRRAFEAQRRAGDPAGAPRLGAIVVVGDAGLGKTRLLGEFCRWATAQAGGARWCEARASERSAGRPYGLLRDLFTGHLQILDSEPAAPAHARWLDGVAPVLESEADAAVLGHLLGFDFSAHAAVRGIASEARQLRDRAFHYAAQYWRRRAGDGGAPWVLVLDDLHWADDGSLDFIDHLIAAHADLPLLVVGLTRPDLDARRPAWRDGAGPARIDLEQLDSAMSAALADALLRPLAELPADLPGSLRALLTERAEGNPFFMEELVNMLIDHGAIVNGSAASGHWTLQPERLGAASVPGSLTGVLQARLDALPPDVRRTLQLAAVVGHVFWDEALGAVEPDSTGALAALLERRLIVARSASSLEGKREFAFKHHTLHQVCYDSVLKKVRRPAHAGVAAWLAAQPGKTHLDAVAEHFERGGDNAQAAVYWQQAAEAARARFANAAALSHAARALALLPEDDFARRYALTVLQIKVLRRQAERAQQAQCLAELQRLAEALDDDACRSEVAELQGRDFEVRGDSAAALDRARRALAIAPSHAPGRAARAHLLAAAALRRLGQYDSAQQHAADGLQLARRAGDRFVEGQLLNQMGMVANDGGDLGSAIACLDQAVAVHRETLNRSDEAATLSNLAFARFALGDYASAHTEFVETLRLCRELGERLYEGIILVNLALVCLNQGNPEAAQEHARLAAAMLAAAGDQCSEAAARRMIGLALLSQGRITEAASELTRSRDLLDGLGLGHLAVEAIAGLALAALARLDLAAALLHVDSILARQATGAGLSGTDEPMRVHLTCYRVLVAASDPRAQTVLQVARVEVAARAAKITDDGSRQTFLSAVPCHRELLEPGQRSQAMLLIIGSITPSCPVLSSIASRKSKFVTCGIMSHSVSVVT